LIRDEVFNQRWRIAYDPINRKMPCSISKCDTAFNLYGVLLIILKVKWYWKWFLIFKIRWS